MAEELTRTLDTLAERGTPRGATAVLAAARRGSDEPGARSPLARSGPAVALATAAVVLIVIGAVILGLRPFTQDSSPVVTTPPAPTTTVLPPTTTADLAGPVEPGPLDRISDVAVAADGSLWTATPAGVVRWDVASSTPTVFAAADGLPDRAASLIATGSDGTVWAAGSSWLARFDGTWTATTAEDLPSPLGAMAIGPDGTVWVAGGSDSLVRFDGSTFEMITVPETWLTWSEPWTLSIAVGPDGTVWASGLMGTGVLAYDGEWRHFGVDDGLPGPYTGSIAVAPDGAVWVGGDGLYGDPDLGNVPAAGIARYREGSWTVFTTDDGLISNDGDVVVGADGTVWTVHAGVPPAVRDALDIDVGSGISRFDGSMWRGHPDVGGGGLRAAVGADGALWMPSQSGVLRFDGTTFTRFVAGADLTPPAEPTDVVVLEREPAFDPVVLSTVIGDVEFTTYRMPDGWDLLGGMTATAHGPVAVDYESSLVWSEDGFRWHRIPVSVDPMRTVRDGDDVIVFGGNGAVRLTWNGSGWSESEKLDIPRARQIVVGSTATVAVSGTDVRSSKGGIHFTTASVPPDPVMHPAVPTAARCAPSFWSEGILPELGPVAATDAGFFALGALAPRDWTTDPVCEPLVWYSEHGDVWELVDPGSTDSPFGAAAYVRGIASREGRLVAWGGVGPSRGALWASDDGRSWTRLDVELATTLYLTAGPRGWFLLGDLDPSNRREAEIWFSTDGLTWDGPYDRPEGLMDVWGHIRGLAVGDDGLIVGSGIGRNPDEHADDAWPQYVVVGHVLDR